MSDPTGVTSAGFVRENASQIKSDLEAAHDSQFGRTVRKDARSVFGQLIGIETGSFDDLWQLIELLANSRDRRYATGAQLDAICSLTNTTRKPATFSAGTVTLTGTNATVVPSGSIATSSDGANRYATQANATIATATGWAAVQTVATGAYRTASGNIYYALVGGVTGSSAPTGTTPYPTTIADGTVTWVFIGNGAAYATVSAQATVSGAVGGSAFTINTIGTPHAGWSGVSNVVDVTVGSPIERDDQLRLRAQAELHTLSAKAALDCIRGALLKDELISQALVFENVENTTNSDGMPPHSVESVVTGTETGANIGAILLGQVAAGIKTTGTSSVTVNDANGGAHSISYTVPTTVPIYLAVTVQADQRQWPSEKLADASARGSGKVAAALLAFGGVALVIGRDVDPSALIGAIFAAQIPGTLSVSMALDTSPNPVATAAIPISLRQIAALDSSRITVSVSYRTP